VRALFGRLEPVTSFHLRWLVALAFTFVINGWLILREARRRGDPLVSSGMRTAFVALFPPFLCGGIFFSIFGAEPIPGFLAIFYGLGLLATGHFAPRSIVCLGWAFLLAGLIVFLLMVGRMLPAALTPDLIMLTTFGGFHFVYATCTWPRRAPSTAISEPS
jgi:hypothetical protein